MVVKDLEQEEEIRKLKEEQERLKSKEKNWFGKVPAVYKIAGLAIIFLKYMQISKAKGSMQELWIWVIGVVAAWYFLATANKELDRKVLTPEQAEEALEKELKRKIKNGQISRKARIFPGPNNGLFISEGMPQYYMIELSIFEDNNTEHKRAIVFATGDLKGYVTIQDSLGKLTGREPIPVISPIPPYLSRAKNAGIDVDKVLFGERR